MPLFINKQVKLVTLVEGDPKALFCIATTPMPLFINGGDLLVNKHGQLHQALDYIAYLRY